MDYLCLETLVEYKRQHCSSVNGYCRPTSSELSSSSQDIVVSESGCKRLVFVFVIVAVAAQNFRSNRNVTEILLNCVSPGYSPAELFCFPG